MHKTYSNMARAQKRKKSRILLPILLIVISLLAVGGIWAFSQVKPPEQKKPKTDKTHEQQKQPVEEQPDANSIPLGNYALRDHVYTVMLIGQRDGNTDTLMVAMLDMDKKEMNVVSIPRDTVVNADRRIPKINGAYNHANGGEKGIEALMDEISKLVGFVPGNYACVNMQGFVSLVDAIGGVNFNVPVRMKKLTEGINLQPGEQLLNGKKALQLVRFRGYDSKEIDKSGIAHDDFGRMQVQQMFLKEVAKQTLTLDNIGKIPQFLSIANKNLETDLSAGNIAWFAQQVSNIGADKLNFHTLPTKSVNYEGSEASHGYYENIAAEEALAMINNCLNPYKVPITQDMVDYKILEAK